MDKDEEKQQKARKRKKRKALSRLKKTLHRAKQLPEGNEFSEWEAEFASSLEQRLQTYDSAFHDPEKGRAEDALSYLQAIKLKEIEDKAKGKTRKTWGRGNGFGNQKPKKKYGVRSFVPDETPPEPEPPKRSVGPPVLRVLPGGKAETK
ncbi:hypothetical protein MNBD_ALPHA06-1544 [hydrothermal vent metagenome]|uniref:Uncharacterized protein n=1 Tax=hydrothermal vent metagenome TaxID=652676 RepID=A0A3B0RY73_9ZZZZ